MLQSELLLQIFAKFVLLIINRLQERSLTQGLLFLYLLDIHLMSKTEDEYIEIVITELKGEVFYEYVGMG